MFQYWNIYILSKICLIDKWGKIQGHINELSYDPMNFGNYENALLFRSFLQIIPRTCQTY